MDFQLRAALHQRGEEGAEGDRKVVLLLRLVAGAEQAGAAVDVPADDEDAAAGVEQGAPHRAKVIGGVDQQARATAGRDAPAGVVLLEDGCVVLGGHVLRQGHGVKGRLSTSRKTEEPTSELKSTSPIR